MIVYRDLLYLIHDFELDNSLKNIKEKLLKNKRKIRWKGKEKLQKKEKKKENGRKGQTEIF